ncbi:polymer-forming cytoskeletal protein [Borrelia miyamotoi]|uniref:Polymer-forming cytoskeletal protein n=1 Tax=Borrelia miyamotoi TaxID=47466 RepID=A0AAX3JMC5_9SPIR|nr:polymer-forming cytoskeletal protein [Borrelia miyamotoi]QFP42086.1 polymer-forming cytoskeletal protein [Borrelia miyamotoi]QFP48200.1 polymer-forming cytoskeletal protein [Borrelia miyamotoi]QGT55959.1 polymer-forming cytoskeletal family protein [Borrelia miyamotoi]QGT56739.1 polymer-forming cytoskeletal family protein [Borrelia miyamotoi]WAZ72001.1 polymer-forming cytoskeletal protein [Borrelia miyamotoi]
MPVDVRDSYKWDCKLDSSLIFRGKLKFEGTLYLDSAFEGEIFSRTGLLCIAKNSKVITNVVVCDTLIVEGILKGNVNASNKVYLNSGCKIYGDIKTKKIFINDDIVFDGKCEMIKSNESIDLFSFTVSQIKDTFQ